MGTKVEFRELPFQNNLPFPIKFSNSEKVAIDLEIAKFIEKGIICEVNHTQNEFISNIFTRKKSDGSLRVILNLNKLNEFVVYRHFKMDTLETAIKMVRKGSYMGSVDLKDAYFSIPIHKDYRKFFRFIWNSKIYEFNAYPQGWASAPRKFTKVLKPVYSTLRKWGHNSMGYIDDSFLQADTYDQCKINIAATVQLMTELGFVVHPSKSVVVPSQEIVFLGFLINSVLMTVCLTREKIISIQQSCKDLANKANCLIRDLARVIGLIVSSFPGVEYGKLHYRTLERAKIHALKCKHGDFNATLEITSKVKNQLIWWAENLPFQKRDIVKSNVSVVLTSDASKLGWGASINGTSNKTGGQWTTQETKFHINYLELLAAFFALKAFCKNHCDIHIKILLDNTTAISYINNMGGTKSIICDWLAQSIWHWCIQRRIWLTAAFVPGKCNIVADTCSRKFNDNLEWKLKENIFEKLVHLWKLPTIDLFASRLNYQIKRYASWQPDPEAANIDAFSFSWAGEYVYAFPPFNVISDVLQKIHLQKIEALMIVPLWTTQVWFSRILQLSTDFPRVLPKNSIYLPYMPETKHKLQDKLQLVAMKLSGKAYQVNMFQSRLPILSCRHGDHLLKDNMTPIFKDGKSFVVNGRQICLMKI